MFNFFFKSKKILPPSNEIIKINPRVSEIKQTALDVQDDNCYTYYIGIFEKNYESLDPNKEYIEIDNTKGGFKIEYKFPLLIKNFNKRKNFKLLTMEQAQKMPYIDFVFTNVSFFNHKSICYPKLSLICKDNYISNKKHFYEKFKYYPWALNFFNFDINTIDIQQTDILKKFNGRMVIVKPDLGSNSNGILMQNKLDLVEIKTHISKFNYDNWSINEVYMPKLCQDYVVTNRVYFMIAKSKNVVSSYVYNKHLIYRAKEKFSGDITNKETFLTNLSVESMKDFYTNRYIDYKIWKDAFGKKKRIEIENQINNCVWNITRISCNDLYCINEETDTNIRIHGKKSVGYNIYGMDIIVDLYGSVKVLEINTHPAMDIFYEIYGIDNRFNYEEMIDEAHSIVLDQQYKAAKPIKTSNNFIHICSIKIEKIPKPLYYIPQSVIDTYPFIYDAIEKRNIFNRTKNMYSKIDFFYGLRERYITNNTNLYYYDELMNDKSSLRMKNASIINKIQGVTYYLASKNNMYKSLTNMDKNIDFVPKTLMINYPTKKSNVAKKLSKNKDVVHWILKPVYGSKGQGIKKWLNISDYDQVASEMIKHMKYWNDIGKIIIIKNNYKNLDEIKLHKKYSHWILCSYINNPHLIRLKDDTYGRKYNIRFYVLLNNVGNRGTVDDDKNKLYGIPSNNELEIFVYADCMIYYAALEYENKIIPAAFKKFDNTLLESMKHLTNLEIVNEISKKIKKEGSNIEYDQAAHKKTLTNMMSNIFSEDIHYSVYGKGLEIIGTTIQSVKNNLRSLNRYSEKYKSSFNLLAYDTMLDSDGKLWLIEINRGPDIVGLWMNVGYDKCVDTFDELFNIVIDQNYDIERKNLKLWVKI
jgi:hypothetical protein